MLLTITDGTAIGSQDTAFTSYELLLKYAHPLDGVDPVPFAVYRLVAEGSAFDTHAKSMLLDVAVVADPDVGFVVEVPLFEELSPVVNGELVDAPETS